MKITDARCRCGCGWSGTVGDCELDTNRDNPICCPNCLTPVAFDDSSPIILIISEVEVNFGGGMPLPTATITFWDPGGFISKCLLQALGKRVEIRILGDLDDPC
jgi:hypothetical protein